MFGESIGVEQMPFRRDLRAIERDNAVRLLPRFKA